MWVGDILAVQNKSLDWMEIKLYFETEIFELVTIKKVCVCNCGWFYHKKLKEHMGWGCFGFCFVGVIKRNVGKW